MSSMKKPELIGPLLGYCNHRAYQRMEQKLRRYGVTPIQCRSLTYLHRQPGPVTQKQLQQHLYRWCDLRNVRRHDHRRNCRRT